KGKLVQLLDLGSFSESKRLIDKEQEVIAQDLVFDLFKEKKGVLVSQESLKANNYDLSIFNYINQSESEPIKENYDLFYKKFPEKPKTDYVLIIPHNYFNLEQLRKDIQFIPIQGLEEVEYKKFYLIISQDGKESKLIALHYFLLNNLNAFSNYYQGSIIKQLNFKAFLNWKA